MRTKQHDLTAITAILIGVIGSVGIGTALFYTVQRAEVETPTIYEDEPVAVRAVRRAPAPRAVEPLPPSPAPPEPEAAPPEAEVEPPLSARPTFTPYTVSPELTNRAEVSRVLIREYPPLLRDAGIGGSVMVHFFIAETGLVERTMVQRSSGHDELDQAALNVANVMRFKPALNRDEPRAVWIQLPIVFEVR